MTKATEQTEITFTPLAEALFNEVINPLEHLINNNQFMSTKSIHQDKPTAFFLDNLLRAMHYPMYGDNKYGNTKEHADRSQNQLLNLCVKHNQNVEAIQADPEFARISFFNQLNTTRHLECYHSLFTAIEQLYCYVTGHNSWVFTDRMNGEMAVGNDTPVSNEDKALAAKTLATLMNNQQAEENQGPASN